MARTLLWIFGVSALLTALALVTGADLRWAIATDNVFPRMAMWVRSYGPWPATGVSLLALGVLALSVAPKLRPRLAFWRELAVVWVLTLAIGSGLITNMLLKEYAERPRPREVVELGGGHAYRAPFTLPQGERGKSFPAGHPTMGFIFAALYWPLRRLGKPNAAAYALGGGLAFGAVIGLGRMLAGAHFFTDVVWSGAIMLATAVVVDRLVSTSQNRWSWLGVPVAVALLAGALTLVRPIDTTRTLVLTGDTLRLDLPCKRLEIRTHDGSTSNLTLHLTGLGFPQKGLQPMVTDTTVTLSAQGYYHDLACQARLLAAKGTIVDSRNNTALSIVGTIIPLVPTAEGWQRIKVLE
jgi:membrane-associated PAP2 superfamily phosphatase